MIVGVVANRIHPARDNWATPAQVFEALDREFGFTLDVCAERATATCHEWFGREEDGLSREWSGTVWMNPPYGRTIHAWIEKAYREWMSGHCSVVALVPASTDTRWFHRFVLGRAEVRFIQGRLRYDDRKGGRCPFGSMVVIWRDCEVAS